MPTNNQLLDTNSASAGPTSRALIEKWGRLHAVHSVLGFFATLIFPLGVDELISKTRPEAAGYSARLAKPALFLATQDVL